MINLCVYGVPPPPYIKEWRRGRAGPLLWRALGSPTPTGSRIPPFHVVGVGEKEGGEREKERGRPPYLVQFRLEGRGCAAYPGHPPCSFIYGGRGTPETHKLIIDTLAVCGAPLHHNPPRSYHRSA